MKKQLMEILACPLCRNELALEAGATEGDEIMGGALTCTDCGEAFPIEDGIPNLLPPDMRRDAAPSTG